MKDASVSKDTTLQEYKCFFFSKKEEETNE